jgi:TonB-dependent SusC/RagA subfamily outer membrane receptor
MKIKALLAIFLFLFSITLVGQKKIDITGHVTDPDNRPVKGAMVIADGNSTGRRTDKNGFFKAKISSDTKVVSILTSDNRAAELPFTGNKDFNFSLSAAFSAAEKPNPEKKVITEEQVNVGYGSVNKRDLTSPVTKVNVSEDKRFYRSVYEMLMGRAGVQVNGTKVTIQGGSNTFYGSTDPLFIIDGIEVSSLDVISPETVSSIEILKGASAAIYGSRGANGVILITTKK